MSGRRIDHHGVNILNVRGQIIAILGIIAVLWLSAPRFYEGLLIGDPQSIFLVALFLGGLVLVLVVAIIDRRLNSDQKKPRPPGQSGK
jgi:hypothetical protein